MKKRILSMILALVMVLGMLPMLEPTAEASGISAPSSVDEIIERLNTVMAGKYGVGKYFTTTGKACVDHNSCKTASAAEAGTAGARQCFGYARYVFYQVFGISLSNNYTSKVYIFGDTKNTIQIGQATNATPQIAKEILSKAMPGDVIQASKKSSSGQHTIVILSADEEGINTLEGNLHKNCDIATRRMTWDYFVNKANGTGYKYFTLYRAKNYPEILNEVAPTPDPNTKIQYRYHAYVNENGARNVCPASGMGKNPGTTYHIEYTEWLDAPLAVDNGEWNAYVHHIEPACEKNGCIDEEWLGNRHRDAEGKTWFYEETRTVAVECSHSWGEGTVISDASCTENGEMSYVCTLCGESKTETIAAAGHTYTAVVTAPTCTEQGYTTYICANCGDSYVDDYTDIIDHSYTKEVTAPSCTEEGYTTYTCANCGDSYVDDYVEATEHSYREIVVPPTCVSKGYIVHVCDCGDMYSDSFTDFGDHGYGSWEETLVPTAYDCGEEQRVCAHCGDIETRKTAPLGHTHEYVREEVIAPTCTDPGHTVFYCSICGYREGRDAVAATGHTFGEWYVKTPATENTVGEERRECLNCDEYESREIAVISHTHKYKAVVTAPTCTEQGYTTYTCESDACGYSYTGDYVLALGHSYGEMTVIIAPTEHSIGSGVCICDVCGFEQSHILDVLYHDYSPSIVEPTCTEEGYTLYTCTNCGDSYVGEKVPAVGHKWDGGKVTKEPTEEAAGEKTFTCTVCGEVKIEVIDRLPEPEPINNPFKDVAEEDYYFEPVMWAVENGITSGLSADTFGPAVGCTRAQVVTFLWRAAGEPAPKSSNNPFKDIKEGVYYYDAVLWAVENGITAGLSADAFGPEATCTRGQIVTFLWRANGKPMPERDENPFGDVDESQYYYDAVLWAVEEEITAGMSAVSFAPDATCTRGQIVTFLYRAYE